MTANSLPKWVHQSVTLFQFTQFDIIILPKPFTCTHFTFTSESSASQMMCHRLHNKLICWRVDFKPLIPICSSLAGTSPGYLVDECISISDVGNCPPHSADKVKYTWICIARLRANASNALRYGSHSVTCKQHHICLYSQSQSITALWPVLIAPTTKGWPGWVDLGVMKISHNQFGDHSFATA